MKQILAQLTPMGRFGEPVEIANAMLFLVSDESSFMSEWLL
jgi:NAD(P)-dependent dehydrogenase (short-subunit alcohol dehydrogenase family)